MTATPTPKHILQKGAACATCKARKVRCNATRPACDACRRSARFRGEDPDLVVCSYTVGRRCGSGAKEGPKRSRSAGRTQDDIAVAVGTSAVEAAPSGSVGRSERWIEHASQPLPALQEPVPPLVLAQPFFLPSPPSSSFSSSSASTPASSSSFPSPPQQHVAPEVEQRPQRLDLPAPIPVAPLSSTLPAFLNSTTPSFGTASLPAKAAPAMDAASLLQQLDAAYTFATVAASPESYSAPLPDPHSPASSASFSSFHSGEDASSSTYSSLSSSPFSLYDDLDFALALSGAPPCPPQPAPLNDFSALPLFSGPPRLSYDTQPHSAAPLLPSNAFFVDHSNPFLPTAHDGDKTLALPLFSAPTAYGWS